MRIACQAWAVLASVVVLSAEDVKAQTPGSYNAGTERGNETSSSRKTTAEAKKAASLSNSISVNSYLLAAYVESFENSDKSIYDCLSSGQNLPQSGLDIIRRITSPRVLSAPKSEFPVWEWTSRTVMTVDNYFEYSQKYAIKNGGSYLLRADNIESQRSSAMGWHLQQAAPMRIDADEKNTRNLLFATAFANYVLIDAGRQIQKNDKLTNQKQVMEEVKLAICRVDYSTAYESASRDVIAARCVGGRYPEASVMNPAGWTAPFVLNCGSVFIDAEAGLFRVNGRPTLSQEVIGGTDIKVVLSSEASKSSSIDKATSMHRKNTTSSVIQRQD